MNNDTELFELCKEVYELTGWKGTDKFYAHIHSRIGEYMGIDVTDEPHEFIAPLYTSDYLLEKLPTLGLFKSGKNSYVTECEELDFGEETYRHDNECREYADPTECNCRGMYTAESDTPLKALLRLVIALHDAGVKL